MSKSKEYETRIGRVRVERGIEREERREGRRGGNLYFFAKAERA